VPYNTRSTNNDRCKNSDGSFANRIPMFRRCCSWLRFGVFCKESAGLREVGLAFMNLVMEEKLRHLAGEHHQQHSARGVPTAGGLRVEATENATAVSELRSDLARRAGWTSAYRVCTCRSEARRWLRWCALMPARLLS
jgi:hypothetical protein